MRLVKGIPDCWYSGSFQDLWVEYKYIPKLPKVIELANPKKYLTQNQQDWLRSRHEEGRNVGVICGSPQGGVFFPGVSWEQKLTKDEFKLKAKKTKDIAQLIIDFVGPVDYTALHIKPVQG